MKLISFDFQGFGSHKMRFTKGTCSPTLQGKLQEGNENGFDKAKNLLSRYETASITFTFLEPHNRPQPPPDFGEGFGRDMTMQRVWPLSHQLGPTVGFQQPSDFQAKWLCAMLIPSALCKQVRPWFRPLDRSGD